MTLASAIDEKLDFEAKSGDAALGINRLITPRKEVFEVCTLLPETIELAVSYESQLPRQGGGDRGKITHFSNASRRRLLSLMRRLDTSKVAYALWSTLTYHDN